MEENDKNNKRYSEIKKIKMNEGDSLKQIEYIK